MIGGNAANKSLAKKGLDKYKMTAPIRLSYNENKFMSSHISSHSSKGMLKKVKKDQKKMLIGSHANSQERDFSNVVKQARDSNLNIFSSLDGDSTPQPRIGDSVNLTRIGDKTDNRKKFVNESREMKSMEFE